jgi:hypothetical protein
MKSILRIFVAGAASLLFMASARPLSAQDNGAEPQNVTFYVDRTTGQVFIRPGRNRAPMKFNAAPDAAAIEQQVEQKVEERTNDKVRAAVAQTQAQQRYDNDVLQKQIAQMEPAWKSYLTNFQDKFRIGALAYLDYSLYTHTGFGPQFLENMNPPGPGNNLYNAFDINRVYLNTYFTPTPDLTFRFTPEIYRANGTASADKTGQTGGFASNLDGDLNVRLKYAYVQYAGLWNDTPSLKGGTVTFGAQQNPLLGWEEDFGGYRFVYLSPWNYLGLSSSQIGLGFGGPVKLQGGEKTFIDYALGVYDNGNFRTPEQTNTKQVMGRATIYPFGANWRYDGFGVGGFYNYGYGNTAPDSDSVNTPLKASNAHFTRVAAMMHYAAENWNVLGESDYGNNAFTLSNMFTGSGPLDAFGTPTGTTANQGQFTKGTHFGNSCSQTTPCYGLINTYGPQTAIYQAILNNGRSRQIGFDFLGHYHIPETRLTAFGMFQWFMPNDNIRENPLDFQRFVAGISYQYNEYLRFALDSQNLLYYHNQFGIPVSQAETFNYVPGSKINGQILPGNTKVPKSLNTVIPNLVPRDIHSVFLNMEFAY